VSINVDIEPSKHTVSIANYDAVVVGAGPYGLSIAAHLLGRGLEVAVFGTPLQLWRDNMPKGMLLRSYWWASNLSDPKRKFGLAQYFQLHDLDAPNPLSAKTFIDYGLWFQQQVVPHVDKTYVATVEHLGNHFKLRLMDGRTVNTPIVVMAPGLRYYEYRPKEYDRLSVELVSHTSDHHTFHHFTDKKVVVIGGGQSGLETAALLHENGAEVELIARRPIRWLPEGEAVENRSFIEKIKRPKAGTALGWYHWGIEHLPYAFHKLPRDTKDRQIRNRFGPAGASWLMPRLHNQVPIYEDTVEEIEEAHSGIKLTLSSSRVVKADHIILATGYHVDISKLPMLALSLTSRIQTYENAPVLNSRFETNVPGLYFVGISSVSSFGPFYRFVVGTDATARRVAASASGASRVRHA
jgi:FAD-dependent urate hydroxylase